MSHPISNPSKPAGTYSLSWSLAAIAALAAVFLPGCAAAPSGPAATQPVTAIDPATAEPGYWYDQPGVVSVDTTDFDTLWKAAKLAARDDGFILDRPGYRDGLMTTQPLVSRQFFQPWLNDVVDTHALIQSSLATMTRFGDGPLASWECVPKVLVERYQVVERRITNETEYREVFNLTREEMNMEAQHERDPTAGIAPVYWYSVGRDHELERQLAGLMRQHINHPEDLRTIVPIG
jgi:hypothetical protein